MSIASAGILCFSLFCFCAFHTVSANPILGLVDSRCIVVDDVTCPNENVTFWLYTNSTKHNPKQLNPLKLDPTDFKPVRPVKVLIHGYTGHKDFAPNIHIRPALLDVENPYVISVDYGALVPDPCYFTAVQNLHVASKCLAELLNSLIDQNIVANEDLHIIGFSLGAHVAGQTANYVKYKLHHITGLDPAKPLFVTADKQRKLDASDANFVDVIHTDILGRGMLAPMGHADFYPNIGPNQPGCELENEPGSCNHERAPNYYAESIYKSNQFWSYACTSWLHYMFGLCPEERNDAIMGYYVNSSAIGSFFLKTANMSPFALGPIVTSGNNLIETGTKLNDYYAHDIHEELFEPQLYRL